MVSALIFSSCAEAQSQENVEISNVCQEDVDCPDNGFCKTVDDHSLCMCKDDYLLHINGTKHRECVKEAKSLGDVCKVNTQCEKRLSVFAVCVQGVCECKDGAHFQAGRCYKTAIIGQRCHVTQNCYLGPDPSASFQAYCVRGFCQCGLMHRPRNGGTRCLQDAILGEQCEDDEHCAGENTRCNSVCRCTDGHVLHPDENRCLKAAVALNDPCEIEDQCTANLNGSTCTDQRCGCQWGFRVSEGGCQYSGRTCSPNQECLTDANVSGQCVGGICMCIGCTSSNTDGDDSSVISFPATTADTNTLETTVVDENTVTDANLSAATIADANTSVATITDVKTWGESFFGWLQNFGVNTADVNTSPATIADANTLAATVTKANTSAANTTDANTSAATIADANTSAATITDVKTWGESLSGWLQSFGANTADAKTSLATIADANTLAATVTEANTLAANTADANNSVATISSFSASAVFFVTTILIVAK